MPNYNNLLLTGEPGIGKTTVIMKVLNKLKKITVSGFYTEEIRSGKKRKGFMLKTLDNRQKILASTNKKSTYKVGPYAVDISVMTDLVVPLLEEALSLKVDLIVIDEIGKMECFSKPFRDVVWKCLDSKIPVLGTFQNFASPFINMVLNRKDVVFIEVNKKNRDILPDKIYEILKLHIPKLSKKK